MELVLTILMVLAAIVLIATVLLQSSESDGMGALAGGSETFFGKNKNSTFEGKMAMATKISAVVFVLLAVIMLFFA
ncbi:MAG: preprotein translocase subunit SecG [Clostridiales bacterium]|nr:preprotein translocase subunit SecG [Clostridiales bacterium]MDD6683366.1 preprotein translocase subunit SecG [Clostridiales bacterium]